MLRTTVIALAGLLGIVDRVVAQYPLVPGVPYSGGGYGYPGYGNPGFGYGANVMPNIYNPRTQPLSPYLNMLRGGNPGVNYYYGVRPGTVAGNSPAMGPMMAPGGSRPNSFPVQYQFGDEDSLQLPTADRDRGYILPPAGHPVVFNNTLGYFPGGPGASNTMPRPGLNNAANTSGNRTGTRR